MNQANKDFITNAVAAAQAAGHVFPEMAACEAAVESAGKLPDGTYQYGYSELARLYNNMFGTKVHQHEEYGTINLPTKEYSSVKGWYVVEAAWVAYPNWMASFEDRMSTLERLKGVYPHYALALTAPDPITYVEQVSLTWSTGPARAQECINIYKQYFN